MDKPTLTEELFIRYTVTNFYRETDFTTRVEKDGDRYFVRRWIYPSLEQTIDDINGYASIDEAVKLAKNTAQKELDRRTSKTIS